MFSYMLLCAPFMLSFLVTYLLIPVCRSAAYYFSILDIPNGTVKIHKSPTPYLGGVAIITGFFCSTLLFSVSYKQFLPFWCGLLLFFLVGLIDDVYSLNPLYKMIGQCISSCWFIIESIYLKKIFFIHHLWLVPLVLFWVILITNAFNLIDILDGLAGSVALQACIGFLIIALLLNQVYLIPMIAGLAGALIAFLHYNKPPALIYMGDAGSLFLGGFFAIIPFFVTWNIYHPLGFFAAFLILAIPIIEVMMLIIIRTYNNIPFYRPSPHHFSHYFSKHSYSKQIILLVTSIFCLLYLSLAITWVTFSCSLLTIVILTILLSVAWIYTILQPFKIA